MFKLITSVILFTLLTTNTLAETRLKAVADEWPPFGGTELPNKGISLDIITAVLNRSGYVIEPQIIPWERALSGIRQGSYDVIGNLFPDPKRSEYLLFSDPIYNTEIRFLRAKSTDANYQNSLDSLKPYSIAVGEGYFYEEEFDNAEFLNKVKVTTVEQGIRMVASGRVDLTLDSIDVLNFLINKKHPELAEQVELIPGALEQQSIHMGVRKDLPNAEKMVDDFNSTLRKMHEDGTLTELLKEHR